MNDERDPIRIYAAELRPTDVIVHSYGYRERVIEVFTSHSGKTVTVDVEAEGGRVSRQYKAGQYVFVEAPKPRESEGTFDWERAGRDGTRMYPR